jgi:hypothetical protein
MLPRVEHEILDSLSSSVPFDLDSKHSIQSALENWKEPELNGIHYVPAYADCNL